MEWQNYLDAAVAIVSAFFGWLFKIIWDAIKELKADLKETNLMIHKE